MSYQGSPSCRSLLKDFWNRREWRTQWSKPTVHAPELGLELMAIIFTACANWIMLASGNWIVISGDRVRVCAQIAVGQTLGDLMTKRFWPPACAPHLRLAIAASDA